MSDKYSDYKWKNGIPYGVGKTEKLSETYYRILSDPYHKWISIEQYRAGQLEKIVYDSHLFDFRTLKNLNHSIWSKELLSEAEQTARHLIRNQDDRAVLIEEYSFNKGKCTECLTRSVHGILISRQKILFKAFGDPFDGVVLYDANQHAVMNKHYTIDDASGEFKELLSENWSL